MSPIDGGAGPFFDRIFLTERFETAEMVIVDDVRPFHLNGDLNPGEHGQHLLVGSGGAKPADVERAPDVGAGGSKPHGIIEI